MVVITLCPSHVDVFVEFNLYSDLLQNLMLNLHPATIGNDAYSYTVYTMYTTTESLYYDLC